MSELLTAAEAATVLGVTARTIRRWAHDGTLPAAMILPGPTGAMLFDSDTVHRLAANKAAH